MGMQRPTLRQLEYFVALADRFNFREAAEACFVSQPALSSQIAQLEGNLGVRLFERTKRVVRMTAGGMGVTLLPEVAVERESAATPGLAMVPFGADGPYRSVGLAWRASSPREAEFRLLGETLATAYANA